MSLPSPTLSEYPNEFNTGLQGLGLTEEDMSPVLGEFGAFAGRDEYRRLFDTANYSGTARTRVDYGNFVVRESLFRGPIETNSDAGNASISLTDCEVDCSQEWILGIGYHNLNLIRCNVYGGAQSVNIGGPGTHGSLYAQDCYFHHPIIDQEWSEGHINPFFCGGVGAGHSVTLKHCTLFAPQIDVPGGGGVTSNLTFLPDFGPINNVTIEDCLIKWTGGAYSAYFGWQPGKPFNDDPLNATNIIVRNNIFERGPSTGYLSGIGGRYGPVTAWRSHPTNVWENNFWDDGTPLPEPTN